MTSSLRFLLVDADGSDLELARLMLEREFPGAGIDCVANAATLATTVAGAPAPALTVLAADPGWAPAGEIRALLSTHLPRIPVVLLGTTEELAREALNPGIAAAGIVSKTTAGYLALGGIVRSALDAAGAAPAESTVALDEWPLPACLLTDDGRVQAANTAFATLLGRAPAALGEERFEHWLADPADVAAWRSRREAAAPGEALEVSVHGADGAPRRCLLTPRSGGYLATSSGGASINVVNTAGREQSSREIHDIAMVFSHDLKEPLHQISRLAQRLGDGAGGADAAKLTEQLQTCSRRASAMLSGVLEYLAVSSREERPGLVDLNRCLEEALDNLRVAIDDSAAHIVSDQLPSVAGDPYQLMHLLQNVLANAIKFRGRERPEIRITAGGDAETCRIAVQDNGIGISESFRERVFDMGKRLHTRDEYPGAGIGLTLCRRIVERHGGSIGIESAEGGGTRVVIELPRAPEHVSRLA